MSKIKSFFDRYFWGHAQNLNDKKDRSQGSIWRHGRAWLYFRTGKSGSEPNIGIEWHFFDGFKLALGFDINEPWDDKDASFHIGFGLGSIYVNSDRILPKSWLPKKSRQTEIYWFMGTLNINIWCTDDWHRSDPWWMRLRFNPADFFLGRDKCTVRQLGEPVAVVIPMPEGNYAGTVTIHRREWKRPRWPWPTVRIYSEIEVPGGVPVPGKGESDYDCGEDAIMGKGCSEPTPEAAVASLVKSALETRTRYGGPNWKSERTRTNE